MIATLSGPPIDDPESGATRGSRSHRWPFVAIAVMVAILAVGLGLWWRQQAGNALVPYGQDVEQAAGDVGTTYYFGAFIEAKRPVVVTQVVPQLSSRSAPASVGVFVCGPSATQIGEGSLSMCRQPRQVRDIRITQDDRESPFFVVAITPVSSGVVELVSLQVSYRDGTTHSNVVQEAIRVDVHSSVSK